MLSALKSSPISLVRQSYPTKGILVPSRRQIHVNSSSRTASSSIPAAAVADGDVAAASSAAETASQVRSFEEIPGPKGLPLIGNVWRYLPLIGEFQMEKLDDIGRVFYSRYGPIVREKVFGHLNIVHLFDPADMETMFRNEGRYPERRSHRALGKYRIDRPEQYSSGGIFCEKGEEWYRLRKISQTSLMSQKNVDAYVGVTQEITDELVHLIRVERNSQQEMSDFEYDLYKWSLENITEVTMDTRMGCLQPHLEKGSEARRLIRAAHEVIEAIHATEIGQTDAWRYYPTKMYRQLCENEDIMAEITAKYLRIKLDAMAKEKESLGGVLPIEPSTPATTETATCPMTSGKGVEAPAPTVAAVSAAHLAASETILGQFFKDNTDASFGDILSTVVDLILAGIDTTAFSAGFLVYYLAKNPDKQEKLRQEVRKYFPDKETPITPDVLTKMTYMRACVREAMRLTPLAVGVGRVTQQDTVIRNYTIPPGVMVISHNQVISRFPEYFSDPDDFRPERWIMSREERKTSKVNPFVSLPFGFGPRSCPGRRLADMNTYVLMIQLMRNFNIEYHHEDIGVVTRLINIPDKAMQFQFNDITY